MAISDIDTLRDELPHLFRDRKMAPGWDDLVFVPIDDPEQALLSNTEDGPPFEASIWSSDTQLAPVNSMDWLPPQEVVDALSELGGYAGALIVPKGAIVPPPDALAFYLPFHYFHPTWWGVYLLAEGVQWLARFISDQSEGLLSDSETTHVSRVFLYSHEAFHHKTEMLATRLEQVRRAKLYRTAFERRYQDTQGTDRCLEEALANGEAFMQVKKLCFRDDANKRRSALNALAEYIRKSGPGYRKAMDYVTRTKFVNGRAQFAEENYRESFPENQRCRPAIWKTFPHAFSPISRVNSRVNYVVPRESTIAARAGLGLRYIGYRQLSKRLRKLAGCRPVGHGSNHEIWEDRNGAKFPVPRHPRDLATGTLRTIIREAGLDLSISEFVSTKV